ncbi:hypothetical protein [Methylobacterium nonmethylotrophicum]|uniref:Uncharacterized protein n=1 Tax=Methylobacterium nonmethylotrophicum TaxID=1141884 RepID=A0A4Z0NWE4_9HYPH|nr:hypothetical protein [Methylobacterium nonmethylotrophicum]TGE01972.1 hypothetical protein EU555_04720 [Methylobacterium nonmethylotrophicum]
MTSLLARQKAAAEKRARWQAMMNDPEIQARSRAALDDFQASEEARRRPQEEAAARTECPCCHTGTHHRGEIDRMVRNLIRSLGADRVGALLSDETVPVPVTAPVEASADPGVAELVRAEIARVMAEHTASVARLTATDDSESCDPDHDPLRGPDQVRRGRGRPPKSCGNKARTNASSA